MTPGTLMARSWRRWRLAAVVLGLCTAGPVACALGPLSTPHSPAEQASIAQAQATLDGMGGLQAHFVQDGPDGGVASGAAWFETGHLRLQYETPSQRIVVATHGRLIVHDVATDATTRVSLAVNPLGLLLSGPVRLSGEIDVTDIQRSQTALQLSLTRASNPSQGLLTLFFAVRPDGSLLLSGLEAVDAERHRTRFDLQAQRVGQSFDPTLFTPPGS